MARKKNWMGFTTLEDLLKALTLDDEKELYRRIRRNRKKKK